jgi:glycosyltransferase involved in cell wall biosynthesis
VIIAAYNEEAYVGSALTSVLRQSRSDWEAIVVDDGSTDATAEVVRRVEHQDSRIRLHRKRNEGLAIALNAGIERSSAPYVSLLDADDLWMPDYLAEMARSLEARPDAGFAYPEAFSMDGDTHRIRRELASARFNPPREPPADPTEMLRLLIRSNFIFGSGTIRRAVLDEIGAFDPTLGSAEDYEMWIRILTHGYAAVKPQPVLAIRRERASAMSMNHERMARNLQLVCERVASDGRLPDDIRTSARSRGELCERQWAAFTGRSRLGALKLAARRRLSPVKAALLSGRRWLPRRPAEVESAFPDLDRL